MQQGLACEQLQNSVRTLCYESVHLPVRNSLLWATAADGSESTEHVILCVQWRSASSKAVEWYTCVGTLKDCHKLFNLVILISVSVLGQLNCHVYKCA